MEPEGSLPYSQRLAKFDTLCNILLQAAFCYGKKLTPTTLKVEDHPLSIVETAYLMY
jgi:hypothetical protein